MRGELNHEPMPDLLRGLARAGATGSLLLRSPAGSGQVFLREGAVVGATSPSQPEPPTISGRESDAERHHRLRRQLVGAVCELVGWREGLYEFRRAPGGNIDGPLSIPVERVLTDVGLPSSDPDVPPSTDLTDPDVLDRYAEREDIAVFLRQLPDIADPDA